MEVICVCRQLSGESRREGRGRGEARGVRTIEDETLAGERVQVFAGPERAAVGSERVGAQRIEAHDEDAELRVRGECGSEVDLGDGRRTRQQERRRAHGSKRPVSEHPQRLAHYPRSRSFSTAATFRSSHAS